MQQRIWHRSGPFSSRDAALRVQQMGLCDTSVAHMGQQQHGTARRPLAVWVVVRDLRFSMGHTVWPLSALRP
jgi:hypothetical protein